MAQLTRDSLINRVFTDPKNYPYGFSRSGDFSITESKALSQMGCLIAALVDGELAPETAEDHSLLEAAFAKKSPETSAEKAWVKYQQRINRPKLGSIYGCHKSNIDEDEVSADDSDIQIELDED